MLVSSLCGKEAVSEEEQLGARTCLCLYCLTNNRSDTGSIFTISPVCVWNVALVFVNEDDWNNHVRKRISLLQWGNESVRFMELA